MELKATVRARADAILQHATVPPPIPDTTVADDASLSGTLDKVAPSAEQANVHGQRSRGT